LIDDHLFPYYTVIDGYLVTRVELDWTTGKKKTISDQELTKKLENILTNKHSLTGKLKNFLSQYSATYNIVKQTTALRTIAYQLGMADAPTASSVPFIFQPSKNYSWLNEAWEEHLHNLSDIQSLGNRLGAKLLFVIIPTREQVYEFLRPKDGDTQWDLPNRRLKIFFDKKGMAFLDLMQDFKKYARQYPKPYLDPKKDLYWRYDRHWNLRGNQLAGLLVSQYLLKHRLIEHKNRRERLSEIERQLREFNLN
jgi:hypothetical protein